MFRGILQQKVLDRVLFFRTFSGHLKPETLLREDSVTGFLASNNVKLNLSKVREKK